MHSVIIFNSSTNYLPQALEVAQIMDESLDEDDPDKVRRCIEISDARISGSSGKVDPQSSTLGPAETFLSSFSASWVYSKVVTLGISFLEHERRYKKFSIAYFRFWFYPFNCRQSDDSKWLSFFFAHLFLFLDNVLLGGPYPLCE